MENLNLATLTDSMEILIPVHENENGELMAWGQDVHEYLGVKSRYNDWSKKKIVDYFTEEEDYLLVTQIVVTNNPKNPTTTKDNHEITIDVAKELCMMEKNEQGRKARKYFIAVEKAWNDPTLVMARALQLKQRELAQLTLDVQAKDIIIKQQAPKVNYHDKVMNSGNLYSVTQIANDLALSAQALNKILKELGIQWRQGGTWVLKGDYKKMLIPKYADFKIHEYGQTLKWTEEGRKFIIKELVKEGYVSETIALAAIGNDDVM